MWSWLIKLNPFLRKKKEPDFYWSLVGNIKEDIPYGEGGTVVKKGTKHFSPGTKVYCYPTLWGDGYERIQVIGRHRGSKHFACLIIQSKWVTNWRKQKIYSPAVIKLIKKNGGYYWKKEKEIDQYLQFLSSRSKESED